MAAGVVHYGIVGGLREDYYITHDGEVHLREIGGNALYAAVGAAVWSGAIGLVSRVGENYPHEWLGGIRAQGFDTSGVRLVAGRQNTLTFYAFSSLEERVDTQPADYFAKVGQPLPAELAEYVTSTDGQESRGEFGPLGVRPADLPSEYLQARGFHLAPGHFLSHATLSESLRREGVRVVTCDPSVRYMQPSYANDLAQIVNGLDAFLPSEQEVRALFREAVPDLWEAAEALGAMGAAHIVIKLGARGQLVYDAAGNRRWQIPAYPVKVRHVVGAGDAFCGGFLTGITETHDPVEAALRGAVSASMVVEGQGVFLALEATSGLAQARLASLRDHLRRV